MQPSFSGLFVTWKKIKLLRVNLWMFIWVLVCSRSHVRLLFMVYYFKVKGLQLRNKLLLSINNYSLAKPKINLISTRDATRSSDKGITNSILYIPNW